jgi:hypothetical protein
VSYIYIVRVDSYYLQTYRHFACSGDFLFTTSDWDDEDEGGGRGRTRRLPTEAGGAEEEQGSARLCPLVSRVTRALRSPTLGTYRTPSIHRSGAHNHNHARRATALSLSTAGPLFFPGKPKRRRWPRTGGSGGQVQPSRISLLAATAIYCEFVTGIRVAQTDKCCCDRSSLRGYVPRPG